FSLVKKRNFSFDHFVRFAPVGNVGLLRAICRRVQTSHSRSRLAWCRKKIGSIGDRKLTMKAMPPGPPIEPCTLSCGWLSRIPSRVLSLWLCAIALANPAEPEPVAGPAKVEARNALLIVATDTAVLVALSRFGLLAVSPRAFGWLKNIPCGPGVAAAKRAAALVTPRAASTFFCAGEKAAKAAFSGALNLALNVMKSPMKAELFGSRAPLNMAAGMRGVLVQSQ